MHGIFSEYRFGLIHVVAPEEDVLERRRVLQKMYPFCPLPTVESTKDDLKRASDSTEQIGKLDLWEYMAVIRNPTRDERKNSFLKEKMTKASSSRSPNQEDDDREDEEKGTVVEGGTPELVSESGGHTWSTAPEPSIGGGDEIEFSDLELEAMASSF